MFVNGSDGWHVDWLRPAGNSKEQGLPAYSFGSFPALASLLYDRPYRHRTSVIGRHRSALRAGEGTIAQQHRVSVPDYTVALGQPRPLFARPRRLSAVINGPNELLLCDTAPLKPHACHPRRDKPPQLPRWSHLLSRTSLGQRCSSRK
jgi:hypothetical protein